LKAAEFKVHNKKMKRTSNFRYLAGSLCLLAAAACLVWTFYRSPEQVITHRLEEIRHTRIELAKQLEPYFLKNELVSETELDWDGEKQKVRLAYTIDPELQKEADKLLKSYKPDYGAIVMMDAETGRILAMSSFQKRGGDTAPNLALKGTFPAASVFKIVTATAALDKYHMTPESTIQFNGGNHTLYKKNVMSDKINRWTRSMTLREAFARSINTVFGRIALEKLEPQDIEDYAVRFGFNKNIQSDLPFDEGVTEIPKEKDFRLTEMASGFNHVTQMSPVQGAMIAAAVAKDGVMQVPYIVDKVQAENGDILFQSEPEVAAVTMTPQGADKLKELMEATVKSGTSRRTFRPFLHDRKFRALEVGGKTGHLTGINPKGRVDWFVGYAIGDNDKIAVAALTVNVDYWTVKSSYLAQSMFRKHFKEVFSQENERFFNTANAAEASRGTASAD
jgi:cell division protein FtsI/penicillin-binding protein 2